MTTRSGCHRLKGKRMIKLSKHMIDQAATMHDQIDPARTALQTVVVRDSGVITLWDSEWGYMGPDWEYADPQDGKRKTYSSQAHRVHSFTDKIAHDVCDNCGQFSHEIESEVCAG